MASDQDSRSSRFIPGKDYRHLFNKDAGWVQNQSGLFEEEKHLARFKPITVQPVSPVAIPATLDVHGVSDVKQNIMQAGELLVS